MLATHLIGHELGHNILQIARDGGVLTDAQKAELAQLFQNKDGSFDEEQFAEAFARELKFALAKAQGQRAEKAPKTRVGKALKPIVDFFVALATSVRNWRVGRGMDAETGAPLQAQSVLEAFLQRQREEAKAMAELNRRRWEQSKQDGAALAEALERSPHQIVLDDDGTPLQFHDPLTNRVPGMFYLEYKDGISNSTCLSALRLVTGRPISISTDDLNRPIKVSLGSVSPYDRTTGLKRQFGPDGTRVKGGSGFFYIVDERVANDYAEIYKVNKEEAFKRAIIDALRVIETIQRGECVERRGERGREDMLAFELSDDSWESKVFDTDILPVNTYRAVVYRDNKTGDYNLTSGYRKGDLQAKCARDLG